MRLECAGAFLDAARSAELRQLCHLEPGVAAGINAPEGREVERHIQRQPVVAAATTDAHADARELAAGNVHPGCLAAGRGGDPVLSRQLDHRALERADEVADPERGAPEVDER